MAQKKIHVHSMVVHAVMACAPLAAAAYLFQVFRISFFGMGLDEWRFVTVFSVLMIFLAALPATLSGVFEIRKMYGRWHGCHKAKFVISIVLIAATLAELFYFATDCRSDSCGACTQNVFSFCGFFVVGVNNVCAWLLSYYGLRISLGRQSFRGQSYTPDYYSAHNPVDILDVIREEIHEEPKIRGIQGLGGDDAND